MLQWFQRLIPREDAFFPAFELHAAVMVKAAVALREWSPAATSLSPASKIAWVITLPAAAVIGALFYKCVTLLLPAPDALL